MKQLEEKESAKDKTKEEEDAKDEFFVTKKKNRDMKNILSALRALEDFSQLCHSQKEVCSLQEEQQQKFMYHSSFRIHWPSRR